jgi:hypothetical protein
MVAGREAGPKSTESTERLKQYWAHGEGATKIRWGVDGDFDRCVALVQTAVSKHSAPLSDSTIKGLCANLHHEATGAWPGHAPGEQAAHDAKQAAKKAT